MLAVNDEITIRIAELKFSYARSPGPGGQNVNKVNSKAVMKWSLKKTNSLPETVKQRFLKKYARRISKLGELVISSHRYRDQGRNVADCLHKLREMILAVAAEPKKRKTKKVSKSSKKKRVDNKRRHADKKRSRRGPKMDD